METRPAAVAGQFYPKNPQELSGLVRQLLKGAQAHADAHLHPKALIAPHAGYIYSGPIAASAYAHLLPFAARIKRAILLGPAHRVALEGLGTPSVDFFETPLGKIPIDQKAIASLSDLPQVKTFDAAHAREHSLEVHLPFLQTILTDFTLVPLVVGDARDEEVAEVLERLWGGEETLVVISSDLSHYHDYDTARRRDEATSKAIETLNGDAIHGDDACGCIPVGGLLQVARQKHLSVTTVDLRNSGDTAGPRNEVVGYGSYLFCAP